MRDKVEGVIAKYITGSGSNAVAARAVALDLMMVVRLGQLVFDDKRDSDEAKRLMAQTLYAFTIGLASNEFWRAHSGYIIPVFNTAVSAWMDSFGHLSKSDSESSRFAFMVSQSFVPEIAAAVLFCHGGGAAVQEHGAAMRADLLEAMR